MDQETAKIAIEKELENIFEYDKSLQDNFLAELKTNYEPSIVDLINHIREIERKPSLIRTRLFLLIGFIFIAMLCPLYFIPETKSTIIIIGILELIIIIGVIGVGLTKLYERLMKIRAQNKIRKVITELQMLAETLKEKK